MKKSLMTLLLSLVAVTVVAQVAPTVAVYQLFNEANSEQVLTADPAEYATLAGLGLIPEGVAFTAFGAGTYNGISTVAVYRLYSVANNQHIWTADVLEAMTLCSLGWNYEGISFYVSPTHENGTVAIHRLRYIGPIPPPNVHIYTVNPITILTLTVNDCVDEGVMGYVLP